ncbi:thioredoxin reductase (NADPH) [Oscillospiraceae bacterium]|nr:thioredoxin reductase (NADPH) [Oscillospiraceae bacterium]
MADIAIIGAGTAGLTAAIYARRGGMDTVVYEAEAYGGQIINTPEIENYPGLMNISGFEFATKLYEQAAALGARIEFDKIVKIECKEDGTFTLKGGYGTSEDCKAVIIATGAKNRPMGLDGEEKLTGKGISYCATCDGSFYKGKTVAVFGGGNTAVEDAIYLADICSKVYIIHRRDEFRAEKHLVDTLFSKSNVERLTPYVVSALKSDGRLTGIEVTNKADGTVKEIDLDGLFVAIGQIPRNEEFKDLISLKEGYVAAGEDCLTDKEGIFTAGDCRDKKVRQLTTAAADGATAALAACEYIRLSAL